LLEEITMATPAELVLEIEKLPPVERAQIAEIAMRDPFALDSEIDRAWTQEAVIRWDAYKKGEVKPIHYEEVMSKYTRP
jgi:putative addiction module component (TIGR02574 family)